MPGTNALLRRTIPTAAALLLIAALPAGAGEADWPEARELVDAHIEATGGVEAIEAQTSATLQGRLEFPAAGISGPLTIASRPPGHRVTRVELEGIGTIHSGYFGDHAWSVDPFMGPRLMEGAELVAQAEQSEPAALMRDPEFVETMEVVEKAEYAGRECYRVRIQWRSGRETFDCYATGDGLLVAMEFPQPSPMGEITATTVLSDYREFGGMLLPARSVVRVMGQEQVLHIESLELGEPDPAWFEPPPAIRTLLEQRERDSDP